MQIGALGLAGAFATLVTTGVLSVRFATRQAEMIEWVEHTYSVIQSLDLCAAAIDAGRNAVNGYAAGGNRAFLDDLRPSLARARAAAARVRSLTSDNPRQQRRLAAFEPTFTKLLATLEATSHAPLDATRARAGERLRDGRAVHAELAEMTAEEVELLGERAAARDREARRMERSASVSVGVAVLLFGAAFWWLRRERRRRERAEAAASEKHALLEAIIDGTNDAVFVKDRELRYLVANAAALRFLGLPAERVIGKQDRDIVTPETAAAALARDMRVLTTGEPVLYETTTAPLAGEARATSIAKSPYRDRGGRVLGVVGILRDITAEKARQAERLRELGLLLRLGETLQACQTRDELHEALDKLAPQFFPAEGGALYLYHASRSMLFAHARWGAGAAPQPESLPPEDCWAARRGQGHYLERREDGPACAHLDARAPGASLCHPLAGQGEILGVLSVTAPAPMSDELRRRVALVAEQMSLGIANYQMREALRNESIRDPLTGLFNRRYTEETLLRELHRAQRTRQPLALLAFDVDHFKRFNDVFGHAAGDRVLCAIAALLQKHTRGADVAGREGGEELVVVLPGANAENARAKAEQLRAAVEGLTLEHDGRSLGTVTTSIGYAVFPDDGSTPTALHEAADRALYQAKRGGRNRAERAAPGAGGADETSSSRPAGS